MIQEHLISSLGYVRVMCASPEVQPGAVHSNAATIVSLIKEAHSQAADVVVFPEMSICAYTIADLIRLPDLQSSVYQALQNIIDSTTDTQLVVVVGLPWWHESEIYNVAAIVQNGSLIAVIPKTYLPNTQEFYEARWFTSGASADHDVVVFNERVVPFGVDIIVGSAQNPHLILAAEICEDLWSVQPPSQNSTLAGATLVVNLSASNQLVGKSDYRRSLVQNQSARCYCVYAYASAGPWESTTDTVYSGHSMIAECGELLCEEPGMKLQTTMVMADVDLQKCIADRSNSASYNQLQKPQYRLVSIPWQVSPKKIMHRKVDPHPFVPSEPTKMHLRCEEIFSMQATALAVRAKRSGVGGFVIGVSGGLDSTLALLVSIRAAQLLEWPLENVYGVSMPGLGTSEQTRKNAKRLAEMNFSFSEISIVEAVRQHFSDIGHDEKLINVVYENAQARERTQILMDLANAKNALVVGTGDMSEIALGWGTYNADHMSMYNVNAGVPKTLVKHLISWFGSQNVESETYRLLQDILNTPISPELQPLRADGSIEQLTEDALGPYEVHDFFLYHLLRLHEPVQHICILAMVAFDGKYTPQQLVVWLEVFVTRFFANQFKRSCMPDGVKIGSVALSPRADLRMPSDASCEFMLKGLMELSGALGVDR